MATTADTSPVIPYLKAVMMRIIPKKFVKPIAMPLKKVCFSFHLPSCAEDPYVPETANFRLRFLSISHQAAKQADPTENM
ncbi:hypothetical protein D3C78_1878300 [compost metagenome]